MSTDGDVTGLHLDSLGKPRQDMWVVKLDDTGGIVWEKAIGGSSGDVAQWVEQTTDGGYIVAGQTGSKDGDAKGGGLHDSADAWVVKLNADGRIMWQKAYGGKGQELTNCIRQTRDGGYIFAGQTTSNDGDVSGNHGADDAWVVKLNATGTLMWQKCLGGSQGDAANSIVQTADGGYIVAANTSSNDSQVSGNHSRPLSFGDYWAVKLDDTGGLKWQKCLGGSSFDYATDVLQAADSGYIVAGTTYSDDGNVSYNHGNYDYWVVKLAKDPKPSEVPVNNTGGEVKVYPTVTDGQVYITIPKGLQRVQVNVYDASGRQVAAPQGNDGARRTVQLSGMAAGMYILQIVSDGAAGYYKIIYTP